MHYQAYKRLRELRNVLIAVIEDDERRPVKESQVITGDARAKEKARKMVKLIKNLRFWDTLSTYVTTEHSLRSFNYQSYVGWNNIWNHSPSPQTSLR